MKKKLTLIYIAGEVRSGTTVLDLLLSDHHEVFSVGELSHLEDFIEKKNTGKSYNWECSCGKQVQDCPFWTSITDTFEKECKKDIKTLTNKNYSNVRNLEIAENCWTLISIVSKKRDVVNIVDASKDFLQLKYLLKRRDGNVIKIVHVIRDSRAVAFSKSKWEKFNPNGKTQYIRAMLRWLVTNICVVNLLSHQDQNDYMVIKYENFAKDPRACLNALYKKLKISPKTFVDEPTINMASRHYIAGSPNKIKFHNNPIRMDIGWQNFIGMKNNFVIYIFGLFIKFVLKIYLIVKNIHIY